MRHTYGIVWLDDDMKNLDLIRVNSLTPGWCYVWQYDFQVGCEIGWSNINKLELIDLWSGISSDRLLLCHDCSSSVS